MAASLTSQFASTYLKLLQGQPRETISPKDSRDDFYAKLLSLTVDRVVLEAGLTRVPKEACLTQLKVCYDQYICTGNILRNHLCSSPSSMSCSRRA